MRLTPLAAARSNDLTLFEKHIMMNWGLILVLAIIGTIGIVALYSAANGNMLPYAERHMLRMVIGFMGLWFTAMIDIRIWNRVSYWIYWFCIILLLIVEIRGEVGMGAQRWIDLGVMQLQPSELTKVALVMAFARYYERREPDQVTHPSTLWFPAFLILIPTVLVLRQPDLGTALMLVMTAVAMLVLAGVRWWLFAGGTALIAAIIPLAWFYGFRDYQKTRILTFFRPEADPMGAGYHVTQSKIALGSGGLTGKGFLNGTQSHLNFLPEKQTDFIFTLWSEEWGLLGGLLVLILFLALMAYGMLIALRCRHQYARLLVMGLTINTMIYVVINTGMVMGLLPVVGVPLPLISYGGTIMMTTLFAYGLILSASIHRDVKMGQFY